MINIIRDNVERHVAEHIGVYIDSLTGRNNVIRRWYNGCDLTDKEMASIIVRNYAKGVVIRKKWDSRHAESTKTVASVAIKCGSDLLDDDSQAKMSVKIGAFGLDVLMGLDMIGMEIVKEDNKTVYYLAKTAHTEFNQLARKVILAYPDDFKYGEWTEPRNNGLPIVKKMYRDDEIHYTIEQMPDVYRALNALGNTNWQIDEFVLQVALSGIEGFVPDYVSNEDVSVARKRIPVAKMRQGSTAKWIVEQNIQSIEGLSDNPGLLAYKKREALALAEGKFRENTHDDMKVISKHAQFTRFSEMLDYVMDIQGKYLKFCYNMDSRGRVYTVEHGISPQGSDIEKSMLQFKDGVQWSDEVAYNLGIHTANCAGQDKLTFEDRVLWTAFNQDNIQEAYEALMTGETTVWLDQFKNEKKTKWQLIAAIGVWGKYWESDDQDNFWVKTPIGIDATCSGLQILSVIGRDETCAEHVNIKKCEYAPVGDLYKYVAGFVYEDIMSQDKKCKTLRDYSRLHSKEDGLWRKLLKRPTMTYPYACGAKSMGSSAFDDRGDHGDSTISNVKFTEWIQFGDICFKSIEKALPRAAGIMKFLKDCAGYVQTGTLAWTNPVTGYRAYQRYEKSKASKVELKLLGKRVQLTIHEWYDEPKKADHRRSIAANFTHSQDSALLIVTVNRMLDLGYTEFHCIHDQFGVNASGLEDMSLSVRGAFIDLFQEGDTLESFRDELQADVDVPEQGTYNIFEIIDAEYAFC